MLDNRSVYDDLILGREQIQNISLDRLKSLMQKYPFHQPLRALLLKKISKENDVSLEKMRFSLHLQLPFVEHTYSLFNTNDFLPELPPIHENLLAEIPNEEKLIVDQAHETEIIDSTPDLDVLEDEVESSTFELESKDSEFSLNEENTEFIEDEYEEEVTEAIKISESEVVDTDEVKPFEKESGFIVKESSINNNIEADKREISFKKNIRLASFDTEKYLQKNIEAENKEIEYLPKSEETDIDEEIISSVKADIASYTGVEIEFETVSIDIEDDIADELKHELEAVNNEISTSVSSTDKALSGFNSLMDSVKEKFDKDVLKSDLTENQSFSIDDRVAKAEKLSNTLVTETMARFLEQKGRNIEAIKVLDELKLKFPEKSAFFAAEIDRIKSKI